MDVPRLADLNLQDASRIAKLDLHFVIVCDQAELIVRVDALKTGKRRI